MIQNGRETRALMLICSATIMLFATALSNHRPPALRPAMETAPASYKLGGMIGKKLALIAKNWLMAVPENNPAILEMFRDRETSPPRDLLPWSGEFAGKYLTASCEVYRLTKSPALKRQISKFVEALVASQDPDGYLGPFPKGFHLTATAPNIGGQEGDSWDVWGHYHAMLGLLLWNEQTGDEAAIRCAVQIGDLLCARFPEQGLPVSSVRNPQMNQAIVHSLAVLYRKTGTQRYLDLAKRIVLDFASPGAGNYLRASLTGRSFYELPNAGPRWESLHSLMALPELYWITGNSEFKRAFVQLWQSIQEHDRHNNGGFSSGEQAQGDPYDPRPIETCCTIAWIAMSVEMLKLTGDPVVADELELSTLNQAVGIFSSDCKWSTYNTPMDGIRIPSTEDISFQIRKGSEQLNCCSVNAPRGLGMISDWGLMRQGDSVVLNWYGPSTTITSVHGESIAFRQATTYPQSGHIDLTVTPARPLRFALKLRVPHWSTNTIVAINGKVESSRPGTYLTLDRMWKTGDVVSIDFDMSLRYWAGEREAAGKSSIYRGPILYALETNRNELHFNGAWQHFGSISATKQLGASAECTFNGDSIAFQARRYDDAGFIRIRVDGKKIEDVDLFGTTRDVPYVWRRRGFGPGAHVMELQALETNSEASKDTWINVVGVEQEVPEFDLPTLARARFLASRDGVGSIETKSRRGEKVRLLDYASAGAGRRPYRTWLEVAGVRVLPFSRLNPSRTHALR